MTDGCGILLKMTHEAMEKRANSELQALNLTLTQVQLLLAIYHSENETCSLKELERKLRVAQSTIVGTTSRLEKKGLIIGSSVPDDKRIKKVQLTGEGRSCCLKAQEKMKISDALLLSRLSSNEKEMFVELLKRVYETIK